MTHALQWCMAAMGTWGVPRPSSRSRDVFYIAPATSQVFQGGVGSQQAGTGSPPTGTAALPAWAPATLGLRLPLGPFPRYSPRLWPHSLETLHSTKPPHHCPCMLCTKGMMLFILTCLPPPRHIISSLWAGMVCLGHCSLCNTWHSVQHIVGA